jgi:hypothetical protein
MIKSYMINIIMFDRNFINLIEIFQFVHIHTANMKSGNKRRESIIKQNIYKQNATITTNALFNTYKGDTITELLNNPSNKSFITYYENWYINF